jgi:hypothetical protein
MIVDTWLRQSLAPILAPIRDPPTPIALSALCLIIISLTKVKKS